MKIHELKELTELPLTVLSRKIGIDYKRILKLNKQTIEHSTEDYDLINKYLANRGKNIIEVDFKTKRAEKRLPFSFERRGEINLNEYKLNKRRKAREYNPPRGTKEYYEKHFNIDRVIELYNNQN